ncbi:securin [Hemiscyllium ocellatum]|uniref:securin n=1 Tax=Hemiscyllium ocellatum TaxID=170820 RepID=UPI002966D89B|nr:securin [Hemiscyllium ocellatum]XP_060692735.1 securin [Hemiscyllium ocellatum]XP_060692737.1 securin [Hemiscyllium ocellatum]XP_060692738.1 securin [Hemiscyllium ocellatum]XP_060692739.1 securin [Hemiscyllium ocellatum]
MAVRIFVEKENELLSNHAKNHPKLFSGSATIETSLLQTPRTGKAITTTSRLQQSARKALGDVNCPLRAGSIPGHSLKKRPDKIHKKKSNTRIINTAKPTEKSSISEPPKCSEKSEDYPEIETFIPYNPLDFENFNVPKEHKLDHVCLAGLPLLCLEKEEALIEKVLNKIPSPPKWPSLVQEFSLFDFNSHADILAELDDVELPTIEDEF